MTLKRLEWHLERLRKKRVSREGIVSKLEETIQGELSKVTRLIREEESIEEEVRLAMLSAIEEQSRIKTRELRDEIRDLQKQLTEMPKKVVDQVSVVEAAKASTLCIFDTLLFAIENWSTDGLTAPDVSLCSQSILFPLVYEQVMKGNEDYYLDKFPPISMEIVRRGRSFVKWLREESHAALTSPEVWESHATVVQSWWINDGLPLLYGARDENWNVDRSYGFDDMVKWSDLPASRVLDFPLIHDGMDLVSKHMDSIREPIGLRSFNQQQIQTRFNHE